MNTNITIRRRIATFAVAAIVIPAFGACGTEISAPAQDIAGSKVQKQDRTVPMPTRTTHNRYSFKDEYGTAKVQERKAQPAGSGTRNRMDFRDDGR